MTGKSARSSLSYHAGKAAELQVAEDYKRRRVLRAASPVARRRG